MPKKTKDDDNNTTTNKDDEYAKISKTIQELNDLPCKHDDRVMDQFWSVAIQGYLKQIVPDPEENSVQRRLEVVRLMDRLEQDGLLPTQYAERERFFAMSASQDEQDEEYGGARDDDYLETGGSSWGFPRLRVKSPSSVPQEEPLYPEDGGYYDDEEHAVKSRYHKPGSRYSLVTKLTLFLVLANLIFVIVMSYYRPPKLLKRAFGFLRGSSSVATATGPTTSSTANVPNIPSATATGVIGATVTLPEPSKTPPETPPAGRSNFCPHCVFDPNMGDKTCEARAQYFMNVHGDSEATAYDAVMKLQPKNCVKS